MRLAIVLGLSMLGVACGTSAAPQAPRAGEVAFGPRWDSPFDTQAGLLVTGDRIVVSDGDAIVFRAIHDARETARAPRTDAFRSWIDEPNEPVLFDLGGFVVASGRDHVLARFDPDATAPRWTSTECRRAWAAARLRDRVAMLCANGLVVLDPETGARVTVLDVPTSTWMEEHGVVTVPGGIIVRAGDALVGFADEGTERFRVSLPGSFGLASGGASFFIATVGDGLVELSGATGARIRAIALADLVAAPDVLTTWLGRVVVDGDLALVEAGGRVHAVSLARGTRTWVATGADATPGGDVVHVCSGVRAVALDRASGVERWSWSVGGCEILGASESRVLVRYDAVGGSMGEGVLAFERVLHATPCEQAHVHGTVRVGGVAVAGLHVRAGQAWSTTSDGALAVWGMRVLPGPDGRAPTSEAITDAAGTYALRFCDHGRVPVVVDHADVERWAGEPETENTLAYLHLDGRGDYPLDFDTSAHGPTL